MNESKIIWRERASESKFIASVWACSAPEPMTRTVLADHCMSVSLVHESGSMKVVLAGPETKPRIKQLVPGYACTTIRLQPGVLLRGFSVQKFVNRSLTLPVDAASRFWLEGTCLRFPEFDDAEFFIDQLHRRGYLTQEISNDQRVQAAKDLSPRSYSRLIKRTTGLSPYQLYQLQRIQQAFKLLKQGMSAGSVATELDFVDQPHLTRVSRQFFGHTPKQLLNLPHIP